MDEQTRGAVERRITNLVTAIQRTRTCEIAVLRGWIEEGSEAEQLLDQIDQCLGDAAHPLHRLRRELLGDLTEVTTRAGQEQLTAAGART